MLDKLLLDTYLKLLTKYGTEGFRTKNTKCPNCYKVVPNTNKTHTVFNPVTNEDLASMTCLNCDKVFVFKFLNTDWEKLGFDKSGWAFHEELDYAAGTTY